MLWPTGAFSLLPPFKCKINLLVARWPSFQGFIMIITFSKKVNLKGSGLKYFKNKNNPNYIIKGFKADFEFNIRQRNGTHRGHKGDFIFIDHKGDVLSLDAVTFLDMFREI